MKENKVIEKFLKDQLSVWPLAAANFRSLKSCLIKEMEINGLKVKIQYNPGRSRSTKAAVDSDSIKRRPCFLCAENRPPEQMSLRFEGRKGRHYHILLNPYPIFPSHIVVAGKRHSEQSIWNKYVDMMDLAHHFTNFTIFYNGPRCGASAPDHFHFQACPRGLMPLEKDVDRLLDIISGGSFGSGVPHGEEKSHIPEEISGEIEYTASVQEAQLYHYKKFTKGVFILRSRTSKSMAKMFYRLLDSSPIADGDKEPMFNLLTWYCPIKSGEAGKHSRPPGNTHGLSAFEYRAVVILRSRHRPRHYFSEGAESLAVSPGCADMAGFIIMPDVKDFEKAEPGLIKEVLSDVSLSEDVEKNIIWRLTRTQPKLQVGLMYGDEIEFEIISDGAGRQKVSCLEGKLSYNGSLYDELLFDAQTMSTVFSEPTFMLYGMTIGLGFHWERKVTRKFAGTLKFIVDKNKVVAVNVIGMEDYLLSVISSEMKASAPLEFLKAHAVISRSWVALRMDRRVSGNYNKLPEESIADLPAVATYLDSLISNETKEEGDCIEFIKWFDHQEHSLFDVCADDHCQRYQGLDVEVGENVRKAVDETWGEVLVYDGKICDARFSKCCGGRSEVFETCWEDKEHPYLKSLPDTPGHEEGKKPFCDTSDYSVLSKMLNDYDLETKDFYRWKEEYSLEALSDLIKRRLGEDLGLIKELIPLEKGPSGRICKLKIKGSKKSAIVGKELMIRKLLSESHLKSSAFDIKFTDRGHIVLEGQGWGHGVGLCQIGAAVMSLEGYDYHRILEHYYPGAEFKIKGK